VINGGTTEVSPGPLPFVPVEVEAGTAEDGAAVRGCVAVQWANDAGTSPASLRARGIEYRLEQQDGGRVVSATLYLPDLDCSAVDLPVALFEPAPEPSNVDDYEQIVRPDRS
jgi:hypothetical protein